MKISFFDKRIFRIFYGILGGISVITSIFFLFIDIKTKYKAVIVIITFLILMALYIGIWIYSNVRRNIHLKINNSVIEVKFGDIFLEQADLKVIAFNEYFDTLVDNKMIAASTLNGKYINMFFKDKLEELDDRISADAHLEDSIIAENSLRPAGKKIRYKLGTICNVDDYLLTGLTRFDDDNRANLEINEYIDCLLNFWNEVDRVYAGKTIALPVLGSGITRFRGYDTITDQELLKLIIWTFKVSRIKFTYPSKVMIVIYEDKKDKINLLELKDMENT